MIGFFAFQRRQERVEECECGRCVARGKEEDVEG